MTKCKLCGAPTLPQDLYRGVCVEKCLHTSLGVASMDVVEYQRPEVADGLEAFSQDFERVHGYAGQGARRLD